MEIDGTIHQVYVLKRPHVDEFLVRMGELFECVLFTASLAKVTERKKTQISICSPVPFLADRGKIIVFWNFSRIVNAIKVS